MVFIRGFVEPLASHEAALRRNLCPGDSLGNHIAQDRNRASNSSERRATMSLRKSKVRTGKVLMIRMVLMVSCRMKDLRSQKRS
jgi:hypothetical protein